MVNLSSFSLLTQWFVDPCQKQRLVPGDVGGLLYSYFSLCCFLFSQILSSRETNSHHALRLDLCWNLCLRKCPGGVLFFVLRSLRKCSALLWSGTKDGSSLQMNVVSIGHLKVWMGFLHSCFPELLQSLVTLRRWEGKSYDALIIVDMTFATRKTLFYLRKLCHFS